ncbi:MAG: Gfo/Idh/MocA family oxidoreductase [Lachnospiraceae bacterium]|nr:Gfo/Idh/MocA family oxidoreductase [Lachnospiraceae bacterium]
MTRIGIIGTGRIARRFVPECAAVAEVKISAVYNPHEGSAEGFVSKYLAVNTGYEAIPVSDINRFWSLTDAVYIASPHETHFPYIKAALEAGKHVLCEKPMTLKAKEAEEAFLIAKEKNLVLMEAIKTAYCPGYQKLIYTAKSGVIGEIRYVDACFTKLENPESRELTDLEYGGSFTELGSYVLLPAADFLGMEPVSSDFDSIRNVKRLDIFTKVNLRYEDSMATLTCGLGVKSEGRLLIGGTKGYILAEAPWWKTRHFEVRFEDAAKKISYDEIFEGDGLRYEISEFASKINAANENRRHTELNRSIFFANMMEQFLKMRPAA